LVKLRVMSGRNLCHLLEQHGFKEVRRSGSHIVMQKRTANPHFSRLINLINMDTDEFSEMAYDIIVQAAWISDTLKAELGALSGRCKNENEWLLRAQRRLQEIIVDLESYVDYWNLEEEEGVAPDEIKKLAEDLRHRIERVLTMPLGDRGIRDW
jgi:hypothetical protein